MTNRRSFLRTSALGTIGLAACATAETKGQEQSIASSEQSRVEGPIVISTWNHGLAANAAAWEVLAKDGHALDAVENGVMVVKAE